MTPPWWSPTCSETSRLKRVTPLIVTPCLRTALTAFEGTLRRFGGQSPEVIRAWRGGLGLAARGPIRVSATPYESANHPRHIEDAGGRPRVANPCAVSRQQQQPAPPAAAASATSAGSRGRRK